MTDSATKKSMARLIFPLFLGFDMVAIPVVLYYFVSKSQTALIVYTISALIGLALMVRYIVKILKFIRESKEQ